jgi:hypothetical protein
LTIKNPTFKIKKLKVAYCSEQILSNGYEDITHPSFNRLKTEVEHDNNTWIYGKRQIPGKANIYTGHKAFSKYEIPDPLVITSRRDFIGRLPEDLSYPVSGYEQRTGIGSYGSVYGNVIDITLGPVSEHKIVYLASASHGKSRVIKVMNKYQSFDDFVGALESNIDISMDNGVDHMLEKKILSLLMYKRPTASKDIFKDSDGYIGLPYLQNRIGANSDNPILLTRVDAKTPESSFRQLVLYAQALANKGFAFNFVILTLDDDDYFNTNLDFVQKLLLSTSVDERSADKFAKLLIINQKMLTTNEIDGLKNLSTLYVDLNSRSLINQVESEYEKL